MLDEVSIMRVFNSKYFGRNEAASIVGGLARLYDLVAAGKIREGEKTSEKQNGKWRLNAWDCLKHASVK